MEEQVNLDGYSSLVKIGEGGMAFVYRGIQDSLNRPVAIKILTNELEDHEEARHRFERESIIIARLNHPNIIHVIDRGINEEGLPYFVMEYIEGIDLNHAVQAMQLKHYDKMGIVVQLLKALSYAHKNNVIHRDIKPDNILVDESCNVKVLDFGIAQFYDDSNTPSDRTVEGTVMGTYNYMSPEQRESAENVTAQSDIYSLGVVMYKLFTGEVPLGHFPPPSQLNPDVPPELDAIILQCLRPNPAHRPASAEALKIDVLSMMQGAHIQVAQKQRAGNGIPQIRNKFQLLDVFREDRFGAVYLYQQKQTGTLLVVKKKLSDSSGFETSNRLTRLLHDNILPTLATTRTDRLFILVQEYLSGGSLQDKLAFELDWKETLRIGKEICQGMAFAHQHHIIHGHLRPTNILFSDDSQVRLTDFGLQDDVSEVKNAHFYSLKGELPSKAADIYSVGVILYQLFTGSLPTGGSGTSHATRKNFIDLPGDIQELITTMLSTLPERRHKDSLQRCISVFRRHLDITGSATPKSSAGKKTRRSAEEITKITVIKPSDESVEQVFVLTPRDRKKPIHLNRAVLLVGALVLAFSQYLLFFDGTEQLDTVVNALQDQISASGEEQPGD